MTSFQSNSSGEVRYSELLEVVGLEHVFESNVRRGRRHKSRLHAIRSVNLTVGHGQSVGLVGESGSGKSTLAKLIVRSLTPSAGSIIFEGTDIAKATRRSLRKHRRDIQMVFQDPYSSLSPYSTIGFSVGEPLRTHSDLIDVNIEDDVESLLAQVGLEKEFAARFPSQMSGGQLQRASIARALASQPKLLVLDEPVSALDMATQQGVLDLLRDIRATKEMSYLFISHDLSVVGSISDYVAVMYLGEVVEFGTVEQVFSEPQHPYTFALMSAVPVADPELQRRRRGAVLGGEIPSPMSRPSGCAFHSRCPHAVEICEVAVPRLEIKDNGSYAACHLER